MTELRPYQHQVITDIERAIADGRRRIIVVAPTGSGKTVVAAEIIRRQLARGQSSLFLAHRREIIAQTSQRLTEHGMPLGTHGVILAGRDADLRLQALVQVASIDTLLARAVRRDAMRLPAAAIVIFDEAHRVRGRTREQLLEQYPDAILIGLTATPCRADGRGLGNLFETMLVGAQVSALTEIGALVPAKVYGPVRADVAKGVGTAQGDYVISQLSRRMNTDALVGDIVRDWLAHGEGRPTVVFAVDIAHSVNIRNQFVGAGVPAEHLDCNTPTEQRAQILRRLAAGETKVVSNALVLTEGWDCPPVACCVLARPTKQLGTYRQMIGRVLRPSEGKADAIILDHAGAWERHGLPADDIAWVLHEDMKAQNIAAAKRERGTESKLGKCPQCDAVLTGPPPCWGCGWMPQPRGRAIQFDEGELGLVNGGRAGKREYTPHERQCWLAQLTTIGRERGYSPKWPAVNYKEKFGFFPPYGANPEPMVPTPEVRSWVRSRLIAYAKSKARAAA